MSVLVFSEKQKDTSMLALELETRITKEKVKYKSGDFGDDVGALCKGVHIVCKVSLHDMKR